MEEIITPPEIKTLVKFLLNNGGPVISGHTKFSVTPQILKQINVILDKLKEDIYVSSLTNADLINKYAKKNELMFLYDFVKKTPKLKISNTASSHDFNVDIADFSNLKYLELYKFNVKHVKNLKFLRDHLEMVVCIRSIDNVGDLLLSPDSESNIWNKLKHAILSRNDIQSIDQSFIYTPWLQYLDISYNHLSDLRPLTCLRNLTYLNASYNRLTEIPSFNLLELKTLLLSSNHISDLSGITELKNLQECDLSGNCLAEHVNLLPLADLPSLISLNLSRNPLSYDRMHRSFTCGYLHENVLDQYFLLDGHPLLASEKQFIRRCSREVINKFTRRLRTPSTSSYSNDDTGSIDINQPIVRPKNSRKTVRKAIIKDNVSVDDNNERGYACSTPVAHQEVEDGGHLEFKKEIEFLRSKYGEEGWLHGTSASAVQNLMNIGTPPSQTPSFVEGVPISHIFNSESSASITNIIFNNSVKEKESFMEQVSTELETETTAETCETEPNFSVYETASSSSSDETDSEENYGTDDLWLVERISDDSEERIFLSLTETELKERNKKNNKIIMKWRIDQIQRYVKISSEPFIVSLHFDVPRRSDRTRKYKMEYADAQKLISRIQQELDKKSLEEYNSKLMHCMKCGAYFCVEIRLRKQGFIERELEYKCSTCGSVAVIEEDESSIQPKSTVADVAAPLPKQSPLSSKNGKVTQSPSSSSIGSAASLDQNNDMSTMNDPHGNNHESDIEIMSNPSQSSIEVLEIHGSDNMKTVLKIVDKPAPIETPASTNNSNNYILTESSSSGSMTDSICTSYELNNQTHSRGPHRVSQSTLDEVLQEESILGTSPRRSIKSITNMERRDSLTGTSPKRSIKGIVNKERRDSVSGSSPKKNTKGIDILKRRDSKLKLDLSGVLGVDIRDKIENFFDELNNKLSKLDAALFANSLYLGTDDNSSLPKAYTESATTESFDFKTPFSFMVDSTNDATERLN